MAPLRVLHVLWDLDIGGNRTETLHLVRHADRSRVEPLLLCGRRPGIERPEEADALGAVWVPLAGKWDRGFPAAVARHAREMRADLLHSHNFNGHIAVALALRRMRPRPAFVATVGGRYRPARSTPFAEALYFLYRRACYASLRRADGVIAVSSAVADLLRRRGVAPSRVRTIPHGVGAWAISGDGSAVRHAFSIPPGAPVVVTVARLDPMKGHSVLLDAAVEVLRALPETRFLFVGGGPIEADLRARARDLGLDRSVIFAGMRGDVPEFLRAADVFVLPSLDEREGFGIALLEAMASGLPIVASRAGGIPEVVPDGSAGTLVPPRDPVSLASAILLILGDPAKRRALGEEGRRLVEGRFSLGAFVRRTEEFYADCVQRRGIGGER
jgi:glycosyltransferase involved in cell wall biosynthesis